MFGFPDGRWVPGRQAENRVQGPGNKKSGTAPTEVSQGGEDPRDNGAPPHPTLSPGGEGRVRGMTPAWSEWPRVTRTIHYHRILDKVLARAAACQAPDGRTHWIGCPQPPLAKIRHNRSFSPCQLLPRNAARRLQSFCLQLLGTSDKVYTRSLKQLGRKFGPCASILGGGFPCCPVVPTRSRRRTC